MEDELNSEKSKYIKKSSSFIYQEKGKYMKLYSYLLAIRPWSLSASLMPTLLGFTLAYKLNAENEYNFLILFLTLLTVTLVHCAGNLVNTYFDYKKGIDSRISDDRTLVDHTLTEEELVFLAGVLYAIGLVSCGLLAMVSPAYCNHLFLVFFGGFSSSFLYTGGIGFKYIALGDVVIFIIFGPVSVLFAYMCQTGKLEWATIYYALPLALNTEAILHSNNTRDLESDRRANIVTLAIILGRTLSHVIYAFLLFTPYIIFVVLATRKLYWFLLPLITAPSAFQIEKDFRNADTIQSVPRSTAKLNIFFGLLYVLAISLTDSRSLPFVH